MYKHTTNLPHEIWEYVYVLSSKNQLCPKSKVTTEVYTNIPFSPGLANRNLAEQKGVRFLQQILSFSVQSAMYSSNKSDLYAIQKRRPYLLWKNVDL